MQFLLGETACPQAACDQREKAGRGTPPLPGPIKWISGCTSTLTILSKDKLQSWGRCEKKCLGVVREAVSRTATSRWSICLCYRRAGAAKPAVITSFDMWCIFAFSQVIKLLLWIKGLFSVPDSGVESVFLVTGMMWKTLCFIFRFPYQFFLCFLLFGFFYFLLLFCPLNCSLLHPYRNKGHKA